MPAQPSSKDPTRGVGPLALVAIAGLWVGARRRSPLALMTGILATVVEFGSSDYYRLKRRWTILSIADDE